jgi:hypothetical protein
MLFMQNGIILDGDRSEIGGEPNLKAEGTRQEAGGRRQKGEHKSGVNCFVPDFRL